MKTLTLVLIVGAVSVVLSSCLALGLWFALRDDVTVFENAAVAANGVECAQIGSDILKRNGTVADAAIATLFCEGVACPQSMGLGGGFLLTIYKKDTGKVETLNAREIAPAEADSVMFNEDNLFKGGMSVAVPGELRGYRELYKRYGRLPWRQLVEPAIKLCRKGHIITEYIKDKMDYVQDDILNEESLREILINPATGELKGVGDFIKRPKLADTLEIIAEEGPDALHNGTLTKQFVKDIKEFGGIITEEDMKNYEAKWDEPVSISLPDNLTLYSSPLPGGGVLLAYLMNILNGFVPDSSVNSITEYHRLVESFKYVFGEKSHLGDKEFVDGIDERLENLASVSYAQATRRLIVDNKTSNDPSDYKAASTMREDHGTAHISIRAPNGDAIAATCSINYLFGAIIRSRTTGIILNNQMFDFAILKEAANCVKAGKQPLSSMSPTIIIDKNGTAILIIGANGGERIITITSFVMIRYLWCKDSLSSAMSVKRVHFGMNNMRLWYDKGFNLDIIEGLQKIGHVTQGQGNCGNAKAIAQEGSKIYVASDPQRRGSVEGF